MLTLFTTLEWFLLGITIGAALMLLVMNWALGWEGED